MKLEIIGYKNTKIDAFTNPIYVDVTAENYAIQVARAIKTTEDEKLLKDYSSLEMYHLGSFDDEKGVISTCAPEMICNIKEVALVRINELRGKLNGKNA